MPTVLRESGFQVIIYTDDHLPMHVHVKYQGREALVNLGTETENVVLRENRGLNRNQLRRAIEIVEDNQLFLIAKWREIYE